MDELLGDESGQPETDAGGRPFQERPWPAISAEEGGGPTRSGDPATVSQVEHPVHDRRAAVGMAAASRAVAQLLRSGGAAGGLRLIHQNWRRTRAT